MDAWESDFNVMLDELPDNYMGFPIETDFRIGIQINMIMEDEELTPAERWQAAAGLLFKGVLPDATSQQEAVMWFLTSWNTDNTEKSKDRARVMDFQIDQWRIYSAFRNQYHMNLNVEELHYWEFMSLLTTLDECAFTRVVDIRHKKITSKMSKEEQDAYRKAKKIYELQQPEEVETEEEKREQQEAMELFEKLKKGATP